MASSICHTLRFVSIEIDLLSRVCLNGVCRRCESVCVSAPFLALEIANAKMKMP